MIILSSLYHHYLVEYKPVTKGTVADVVLNLDNLDRPIIIIIMMILKILTHLLKYLFIRILIRLNLTAENLIR